MFRSLLRILAAALAVMTVCAPSSVRAQSTGKIVGTVTDESGEPLPGVSVYLESDPTRGTTTDVDGDYLILSVQPGTYTIVMSYIGFTTLKHEDVTVFSGRTTTLDGRLREEVIEGEEIIVSADRPIVVRDRTTSVSFVQQEAIDRLPVRDLGDLVRFQPGVVSSGGAFHVRGGRSRETAYLIDGIPVQDVFSQGGGNTMDIEVQSVQELQVFTGTFDAEYGGAQSGVVSVTTRDPGNVFSGSLLARAGGFYAGSEEPFIGGDRLDPLGTKDVMLTLSGPITRSLGNIGFFLTGRYEDHMGHLKGERRFLPEDGLKIDTYRRWYRDVYSPGDTRMIALDTARTPTGEYILDRSGAPITFASGNKDVVDMDRRRSISINPKLVIRPSSRTRLTYAFLFNDWEGQFYNDAWRYAPDARPTITSRDMTHIVTLSQTLGSNKVLTLRGSYKTSHFDSYAFINLDDPAIQFSAPVDDVTGFSLGSTSNGRSERSDEQIIIASDFHWQFNDWNEFKTGFQFRNNTFVIEDHDRSWVHRDNPDELFLNFSYPPARNFESFEDYYEAIKSQQPMLVPELERFKVDDRFEQSPIEFAFYVQDKVEFESRIVVNAGARFEYFDVREQRIIDPRTPTDRIGLPENFEDTPPRAYLSPRLGISYPISAQGAFRVAYGHFVQMPAYQEMFKNPVFAEINVGRLEGREVGNPSLKPERTIKYEMGLQQQITEQIGVDVSLFYKNVRNLLGTEIFGTLDNVTYTRTVNRDYGLVRGGTFAIVLRPQGILLNSTFDVTYSDARGSSSNPFDVANIVIAGRSGEIGDLYVERSIAPLNWDQTLTANLTATFGKPRDWNIGFIGQIATGQPYTPSFLDPSLDFPENEFLNAERKPILLNFDVNAEKLFKIGRASYGLRVQVDNVFNFLNEQVVNAISGRAGQIVRLPVVQADREEVIRFARLFDVDEADLNAHWYSPPRQVLVGLKVTF